MRVSARELLMSSDPLSDNACTGLLDYKEEDTLVDFKADFDLRIDKSWIAWSSEVLRHLMWLPLLLEAVIQKCK